MPKNARISFEALLILVVLIAHLYVALSPANSLVHEWYSSDDAFYYFKTAQNITEGRGVTFDGIARTNGFHPLWMLVNLPIFALARIDLMLPLRLLVMVLAALSAGTAALLYRLSATVFSKPVAALIALFWAFSPRVHSITTKLGMEAGISAFFIALLLYRMVRYENRQAQSEKEDPTGLLTLGLAAILTLFSRLDNIFLVLMAGLWLLFRRPNIRHQVMADILLITAAVFGSYLLRFGFSDRYYWNSTSAFYMLGAALVIKLLLYYFFGLYRTPRAYSLWQLLARLGLASALAALLLTGLMMGLFYLDFFKGVGFPRSVLGIDWLLSLGLLGGVRLTRWWGNHRRQAAGAGFALENGLIQNWKAWLTAAAAYFAPIAAALALYMAWNYFYFGTPTPVSGQVKHWWGTLPNTVYGQPADNLGAFLGLTPKGPWGLALSAWYAPATALAEAQFDKALIPVYASRIGLGFAVLAAALLVSNWKLFGRAFNRLAMIPLFLAVFLQVIYYQGSGYLAAKAWYWMGANIFTVLVWGIFAESLWQLLQRLRVKERLLQYGAAAIGALLLGNFLYGLALYVPWQVAEEEKLGYLGGVMGLEAATEPGSLIGSTGGGTIAYFIKDRTIVNLDGLINSYEYFQYLKAGKANVYLDRIGLDYIYGNDYMLTSSDPYFVFTNRVKVEKVIIGSTLFRYLPNH